MSKRLLSALDGSELPLIAWLGDGGVRVLWECAAERIRSGPVYMAKPKNTRGSDRIPAIRCRRRQQKEVFVLGEEDVSWSSQSLWTADIDLDAKQVLALLRKTCPELSVKKATLIGEGWDFQVYCADGKHIFRFPKRTSGVASLERELLLLPILERWVPIQVPKYTYASQCPQLFPHKFAGYKCMPGYPLASAPLTEAHWRVLVRDIGAVLRSLRSFPFERYAEIGLEQRRSDVNIDAAIYSAKSKFAICANVLPTVVMRRLRCFLNAPQIGTHAPELRCLLHGDLRPEHIFVDKGVERVVSVIDWSDACIGPQSVDVLWLWIYYGSDFTEEILRQCSGEEESYRLLRRVVILGICKAVVEIAYGVESRDEQKLSIACHALEREFRSSNNGALL